MNATQSSDKSDRMARMGLLNEPAGYVDGPNLYEFVGSNPVDRVDPAGLRLQPNFYARENSPVDAATTQAHPPTTQPSPPTTQPKPPTTEPTPPVVWPDPLRNIIMNPTG